MPAGTLPNLPIAGGVACRLERGAFDLHRYASVIRERVPHRIDKGDVAAKGADIGILNDRVVLAGAKECQGEKERKRNLNFHGVYWIT